MTGGTSTYEALLMGLPVVTMNGPGYHQKLSATMLHHIGLQECIAESEEEYVSIASSLARDVNRLRLLRQNAQYLRTAIGGLCDGKAYALRFEKALLKAMHKRDMLGDDWMKRMEDLMHT
jgi:predicted O-linked N-acetylglucosamine transferase (SPINDLY family)